MKYLYKKEDLEDKKEVLTDWYKQIYNILVVPAQEVLPPHNPGIGTSSDKGCIVI